jgi:hypothetical protein
VLLLCVQFTQVHVTVCHGFGKLGFGVGVPKSHNEYGAKVVSHAEYVRQFAHPQLGVSYVHVVLHQSQFTAFPSSHCSDQLMMLSPQNGQFTTVFVHVLLQYEQDDP